jgi:23S rRNA pseudouridine1911/1915/1917 synthase
MVVQGSSLERSWSVSANYAGVRLATFLRARLPFLSRRELEGALSEQCFTVNGRRARKGDRIARGDLVRFTGQATWLWPGPIPNPRLAVPVIHEDAHLLAFDKPAGMDCHGFSGRDDATLVNFLLAGWPELSGVGTNRWEPGLVHRLDRDTSGLVLVAKTQAAFDNLRRQFRRRGVKKTYQALVWGRTPEAGNIAFPLAHDHRDERKMRAILSGAAPKAKKKIWRASTHYRKLGEQQGLSLLELGMETGVTHQLRAHLAAITHPIVGDRLYGADRQETFGLRRHFLHSAELQLIHPGSNRLLTLTASLPPELVAVLARLNMKLSPI